MLILPLRGAAVLHNPDSGITGKRLVAHSRGIFVNSFHQLAAWYLTPQCKYFLCLPTNVVDCLSEALRLQLQLGCLCFTTLSFLPWLCTVPYPQSVERKRAILWKGCLKMDCFITGESSCPSPRSIPCWWYCYLESVIFSVTLVLTVMIIASSPGTKNIAAQWVRQL
jgi:hypothetical protein